MTDERARGGTLDTLLTASSFSGAIVAKRLCQREVR
jgi:hypothetical protein